VRCHGGLTPRFSLRRPARVVRTNTLALQHLGPARRLRAARPAVIEALVARLV
jgi:hypothetical protein